MFARILKIIFLRKIHSHEYILQYINFIRFLNHLLILPVPHVLLKT